MANNPEFKMRGISFVISAPTGSGHPLPFLIRRANGKRIEVQRSLQETFEPIDVANELRLLASDIERSSTIVIEQPLAVDAAPVVASPPAVIAR